MSTSQLIAVMGAYWFLFAIERAVKPQNHRNGYISRGARRLTGRRNGDLLVFPVVLIVAVSLREILGWHWLSDWLVWGYLLLELIDDYFNGDDDQRKRRKEWAKNKVKWLMKLPAPARVKEGAA